MPGSLVRDALAPQVLTGATLNAAGTTNGTVQEIDKPGDVRAVLTLGTVTGTSPTLGVELKGADDAAFSVNVVSFGQFAASSGGSQSNTTKVFDFRCDKQYIRATVVAGGTSPVYTGSTCYIRQENDRRTPATDTA